MLEGSSIMKIDKPTEEEKFCDFAKKQVTALELLMKERLVMPTLMVLYSTMDIMSFVWAGDQVKAGERFMNFVGKYIIKHLPELTEYDLWGARCAILHTATPESTASRKGNARIIFYSWGAANIEVNKEIIKRSGSPEKYVATSIEDLIRGFAAGVEEFCGDMEKDPEFQKVCMDRVKEFYAYVAV